MQAKRPNTSGLGLLRANGGATMVIGLFMSVFLVGVLFHLVTVGRSVLYRERMQDAADQAAFEGALGHARSMNEIALANNIQIVATASVFGMRLAVTNIDACTPPGLEYQAHPQVLCPPLQGPIRATSEASMPGLVRLIRQSSASAVSLRDATPGLVNEEVGSMVGSSGTGERRIVAAATVERPMPLTTGGVDISCARAGPYIEPLLLRALPRDLVASFPRPPMRLYRDSPDCPFLDLPAAGPQIMDPGNQSGTEELQVRAIVVGAEPLRTLLIRDNGVRVAERTLRIGPQAASVPVTRQALRRVGLAQAEYYAAWEHANAVRSDTAGFPGVMPEENTFYMHWRARMRRLRVPVEADPSGYADSDFANFVHGPLAATCWTACARESGCGNTCASLAALVSVGNNALH